MTAVGRPRSTSLAIIQDSVTTGLATCSPVRQVGAANVTPAVAVAAGHFDGLHDGPADRLISAAAAVMRVPLVTQDDRRRDLAAGRGDVEIHW